MSSSSKIHSLFATDLLNNNFTVPTTLLKFYRQIGLDDIQFIIILHLLADKNSKSLDQYFEELNIKMACNRETINKALAHLIERNILTIEGTLQLEKLLIDLDKCWQNEMKINKGVNPSYDEAASLYTTFEQEFGRLLSPMEGDQIQEWLEKDKFDYNLIKGALKRSVLRGVLNFKYIDSILREWRKKNYKTINDVISNESNSKKEINQQKASEKTNKKPNNKYKDIYMG